MEQPDERPAAHLTALYWCILLLDGFTSRVHRLLDRIARLRSNVPADAQPPCDAGPGRGTQDDKNDAPLRSSAADGHA